MPLKRSDIAIPYPNTGNLHFRHLKTMNFKNGKFYLR